MPNVRSSAPRRSWRSAAASRAPAVAGAAAAIAGVALASRALFGSGSAGYDPLWSLIWGRQLTSGELPDFEALAIAPTPHPLANAVAAIASLFGQDGPAVLAITGFAGLGLLAWAAYRLGRELFGVAVGVGFAVILTTSAPLVDESLQAVIDVPFLALVLWAAALQARRPEAGAGAFVVLALAGLLRPEAWLLSGALWLYRAWRPERADLWRCGALALGAPAVWMACDLAVTGDPLYSLHATRSLGNLLGASSGGGRALDDLPESLRFLLPDPVIWAGLGGVVLGLGLLYRQSLLPAILLGLGLLGFAILGVTGLPLVYRYAFVPGAMVALFCAVALLGWTQLATGRSRARWLAGAVPATAVVIGLSTGGVVDDLSRVADRSRRTASDQRALRAIVSEPASARALRRCQPVLVRDFLLSPLVAYRADIDARAVTLGRGRAPGSVVAGEAATPPRGFGRPIARNARWSVYARCPPRF